MRVLKETGSFLKNWCTARALAGMYVLERPDLDMRHLG